MTPMPVKPKVVLLIDKDGTLVTDRNNLGNDLEIVVTRTLAGFNEEAAGVPYSGEQRKYGEA